MYLDPSSSARALHLDPLESLLAQVLLVQLAHLARQGRVLRVARVHNARRLEKERSDHLIRARPVFRGLWDDVHVARPQLHRDLPIWSADVDPEQTREDVEELVGVVVFVPAVSERDGVVRGRASWSQPRGWR